MNAFSLSLAWLLQAHVLTQALCRGMPKIDCMRYFPILNYLPVLKRVCVCVCVCATVWWFVFSSAGLHAVNVCIFVWVCINICVYVLYAWKGLLRHWLNPLFPCQSYHWWPHFMPQMGNGINSYSEWHRNLHFTGRHCTIARGTIRLNIFWVFRTFFLCVYKRFIRLC